MEIMKKIWKGLFILQITRFVCYSVAFVKNKKKKKIKQGTSILAIECIFSNGTDD